ncbi:hypothetical protein OH77DRAFT_723849 [Trametes cingulata]|nr:hypothetical protein OH77DRAFT_723849 [Trametes cingulata]
MTTEREEIPAHIAPDEYPAASPCVSAIRGDMTVVVLPPDIWALLAAIRCLDRCPLPARSRLCVRVTNHSCPCTPLTLGKRVALHRFSKIPLELPSTDSGALRLARSLEIHPEPIELRTARFKAEILLIGRRGV